MIDGMELLHRVRTALHNYGEGFSLESGHKALDVKPDFSQRPPRDVIVTPAYYFVKLRFYRNGQCWSTEARHPTAEGAAMLAIDTVRAAVSETAKPKETADV